MLTIIITNLTVLTTVEQKDRTGVCLTTSMGCAQHSTDMPHVVLTLYAMFHSKIIATQPYCCIDHLYCINLPLYIVLQLMVFSDNTESFARLTI